MTVSPETVILMTGSEGSFTETTYRVAAPLKFAIGRRHIDGCDMLFVLSEIRVAQGHALF
jgi:hypothetical protein